jgi:hypothetical protein
MAGIPVLSFLDRDTLSQEDSSTLALHALLIQAYDDEVEALVLAGQVGLLKADIARHPKLRFTWWSILEEAAKERQLRRLVDLALRDPTTARWHPQILEVVAGPGEPPPPAQERPEAPLTDAQRREAAQRPEVGQFAELWDPGTTLRMRFLNGSPPLRAKVEAVAREWIEYANLKLEVVDDPDAQVRVSFDRPGSWSYLGRQCLSVAPDEPTINFGWLTDTTARTELRRVVLHEFGHVLGLQHEHGNPASTIEWDRPRVYEALSKPPNLWTREMVDNVIFAIWPPRYFPVHKVFDRSSIMIFPLPADYLLKGRPIGWNTRLSPLDKQFAAALYPQRSGGRR